MEFTMLTMRKRKKQPITAHIKWQINWRNMSWKQPNETRFHQSLMMTACCKQNYSPTPRSFGRLKKNTMFIDCFKTTNVVSMIVKIFMDKKSSFDVFELKRSTWTKWLVWCWVLIFPGFMQHRQTNPSVENVLFDPIFT